MQDEAEGTKKRSVEYAIFKRWKHDLDRDHQMMSWLDCTTEKDDVKTVVAKLKCKVCTEFIDKIRGRKNFSEKWIVGADSVRVSNVYDHAKNEQPTHAMSFLKKHRSESTGLGPLSYAPIAQALSKLSEDKRGNLRVKFA